MSKSRRMRKKEYIEYIEYLEDKLKAYEEKVRNLELEKIITKSVYEEYFNYFIETKEQAVKNLVNDPVITFPNGSQLVVSSLTPEQYEYLESLGKNNTIQKK